jgi:hypothetical protein
MGRLMEVFFDALAIAWWAAGASTLTNYATDAPSTAASQRNAVIALCWTCVAMFAAMLIVNGLLV